MISLPSLGPLILHCNKLGLTGFKKIFFTSLASFICSANTGAFFQSRNYSSNFIKKLYLMILKKVKSVRAQVVLLSVQSARNN
jgi:hypothetical protein